MAASCSFEDTNGAISWNRLEALLSSQQSGHGCRRIVFDVVQRLKSKRYETVLNTFTLLHTYSVNASPEALKHLASDHICNVFIEIQRGKSNTLAAGLAQLLHDWKHMFRDEGLGARFDQLYHDVLPRAAPQIRPSAPAEKYLRDPPTGDETFRRPLHKGFDFALFNQKARRISFASGAAQPNASSSTGGSSNMPQQPSAPGAAGGNFYRATTLPTPTSDRVHPVPVKQPSADVHNTPMNDHAVLDQVSPVSSGNRSPSPLAADYANQAPPSPSALPAPRHPGASKAPQPQPQIISLVSRQIVPAPRPVVAATTDRTHDNITKSTVGSMYPDSAPLDTTMPEPPAVAEPAAEAARGQPRDATASSIGSNVRTQDPPTESDAGVAGNSISRLQQRLVEDFGPPGSPKHDKTGAVPSQLSTMSVSERRSVTMPPLVHSEGSSVTEDSNCVVSEILSTQPGTQQYVPSTVAEESATDAAEVASVLEGDDDVADGVLDESDAMSNPAEEARSSPGTVRVNGATSGQNPLAESLVAPSQSSVHEVDVPLTQAPTSVPAGRTPTTVSDSPSIATPASEGEPVRAAGGPRVDEASGHPVRQEGPHTMALKLFESAAPGAATMSFNDCAPRNIVKHASDLLSNSDSAETHDTMAAVREAQRQVDEPLQPTPEEGEENTSNLLGQEMPDTPAGVEGFKETHAADEGTRETPTAGDDATAVSSSDDESPSAEELTPEALRAKELIDALVTHCELVARFRRLVEAARADSNQRQEDMFLELGSTQAQTCRQQRQQLHRALALLGAEKALMSDLLRANDFCSLELRKWEQMAGTLPHGADDRPGQPLQELVLKPNAAGNKLGLPDAAMAAKVAQHSLDDGHVSVVANVARQPALRVYDAAYIAAIATATRKHAH